MTRRATGQRTVMVDLVRTMVSTYWPDDRGSVVNRAYTHAQIRGA
jgi:hypothetical protein